MPSEPRIQIEARPGRSTGPAKRLEKWVNRKVPIGTPLPFPDFHDVLRCVREANDEDRLGWNEADIMEEARDLFVRCGKKLQRRRQENEWRIAVSRISHDVSTLDPAETSDVLRKRLEENKIVSAKKETEVLNKYADKQNQLKLVAEEIGDKEAEESPVESEDDDVHDDSNSLEDKEKRKERLRRLLYEKTRKMSADKENVSVNESKVDKEVENKETAEKIEGAEGTACKEIESNTKEEIQEIIKDTETEVVSNDITNSNIEEESFIDQKQEKSIEDDEKYDVESDIDELHLLQKLYSENEINSSLDSDSDTPIAYSDTLDSDSDTGNNKKQQNYDIISIEDSSYSESEITKDECSKDVVSDSVKENKFEHLLHENAEIELASMSKSKVDDYDENILLASSDEEKDSADTYLHTIKVNNSKSSSTASKLNDEAKTNNDEVIIDEEMPEENNMVIDKVITENEEHISVANNMTTEENFNDFVENIKNDDVDLQDNLDKEANFNLDQSMSAEIVQKDEDNLEVIDSTNQHIIISEVRSYEEHHIITDEVMREIDVNNYEGNNCTDTSKCAENSTATKEVISERYDDNIQTKNPFQQDDGVDETHVINTVLDERNLSEREVTENVHIEMDGVEINDSLSNQQLITSDNVKVTGKCK